MRLHAGHQEFRGAAGSPPRRGLLSRLFGGGEPETPAAVEQRGRPRFEVGGAATLTEMDRRGVPGRSWPAEILNVSKGGAAVSTAVFIAPGASVMVQFSGNAGEPARQLMATVLHIRRRDELSFAVGLKFEAQGRLPRVAPSFNLSAGA